MTNDINLNFSQNAPPVCVILSVDTGMPYQKENKNCTTASVVFKDWTCKQLLRSMATTMTNRWATKNKDKTEKEGKKQPRVETAKKSDKSF